MKQITKSYLEYLGITEVKEDSKVFTKNGERKHSLRAQSGKYANKKGYLEITFGDKGRLLLHQIVYAWFNGEVPYGKEIHHKDGNHLNNHIDNLVALTKEEHRKEHRKMREEKAMEDLREEKCRLDIPREHYVKKIEQYMQEKNYSGANQYKRRLKYYDNHIDEYQKTLKSNENLELIRYLKKTARESGDKFRWHQYCRIEKDWNTYDYKLQEQLINSIVKHCM